MIYFGKVPRDHLHAHLSGEVVDPTLPVDWARPDVAGQFMDYWPAYHAITPQGRAAYLMWLASGRCEPNACIGYVFLFFYGLERRALIDAHRDPAARAELPQILAEVVRLLQIYGGNRSFRQYATDFEQVLRFLLAQGSPQPSGPAPDPAGHDHWEPPFALRAGLGAFAMRALPVPVDWALSWAMLHPDIYLRTPATRCATEFRALFSTRYRERYGDGIVVRPLKQRLTLPYRAASAAITDTELALDLPDVLTAAAPTRVLTNLVDSCTDDLDAYSRLLGRFPQAAGSVSALALLPAELLTANLPALQPMRNLVRRALPVGVSQGNVDMAEVVSLWPPRTPGKFAKADAVGVAQLLDKFGVGIEPDVRMGGAVQVGGPAVLFRTADHQPVVATAEYAAATALLHLAAVVSAADDEVSDVERDHLVTHLESSLQLSPGERVRLTAHLTWLLASELKLTGLKKLLTGLTVQQRAHVAEFATTIAAVDGHIAPGEVKTLRKIYTLLELDPETVYTKLHALTATPAAKHPTPAREPVTVVPADRRPTGYCIPSAPEPVPDVAPRLDPELIQAKMKESAEVAALLAEVFDDEETVPQRARAADAAAPVDLVATLDAPHSTLLRRLAERPSWERVAFDELCAGLDLLPEGALDMINEVAMEITDEPVVEDDGDQLRINDYALGEVFA
jgi:tellurite resistance protein